MGKYEPLRRHLESLSEDSWEVPFAEIETLLRFPLPASAHRHSAWWANESHGSHSHSRSWQDAGWETSGVDLRKKRVRFRRGRKVGGRSKRVGDKPAREDLMRTASELTGLKDHDAVIDAALQAFVRQETAKELIALGGSDPDAKAPPRRRFW